MRRHMCIIQPTPSAGSPASPRHVLHKLNVRWTTRIVPFASRPTRAVLGPPSADQAMCGFGDARLLISTPSLRAGAAGAGSRAVPMAYPRPVRTRGERDNKQLHKRERRQPPSPSQRMNKASPARPRTSHPLLGGDVALGVLVGLGLLGFCTKRKHGVEFPEGGIRPLFCPK